MDRNRLLTVELQFSHRLPGWCSENHYFALQTEEDGFRVQNVLILQHTAKHLTMLFKCVLTKHINKHKTFFKILKSPRK